MSHWYEGMNHVPHLPPSQRSADQSAAHIHAIHRVTSVAGWIAGGAMGGGVGALLGMLAGPPGMWTGAALGVLAGVAACRATDVQGARTSKHDAELDDVIGVTSRNLGRPPQAREGASS